jgi:damage-control phosphatase, subfamily I
MKFDDRCVDCLLSRVALECRLCGASPEQAEETLRSCAALLDDLKGRPLLHPQIASAMHRRAYELLGNEDPFASLKEAGNREAIAACREVRPLLRSFRDFCSASIIGNTYDYGVKSHTVQEDFLAFFRSAFAEGLIIDDTDRIRQKIARVVYFTDNCGEIVFDRLLLGYLHQHGSRITLVVRDAPILNDATMTEALALHLDRFVDTIATTGCGCELGVRPECLPPEVSSAIASCTLIISKGMANYESFSEFSGLPPVAYLMAVKCDPIADAVGVPRGSRVAMLRE